MILGRVTDNAINMIPFYIAISLVPLGAIFAMGVMLWTGPAGIRRLREENEQVRARLEGIELDVMNSARPRPRLSLVPWHNYTSIENNATAEDNLNPTTPPPGPSYHPNNEYRGATNPTVITSNRPIQTPRPVATPPGRQRDDIGDWRGRISTRFQSPIPNRPNYRGFVRLESTPTLGGVEEDPFEHRQSARLSRGDDGTATQPLLHRNAHPGRQDSF